VVKSLILSLDVDEEKQVLDLVRELKDEVSFKVGKQLFTRYGPEIVKKIRGLGGDIFLDLKFHDIPNTVSSACREAVRLGVQMFNVHASGAKEMLSAAVLATRKASQEFAVPRPILLAVTVLTSLTESVLKEELGCVRSMKEQVLHLAGLAQESAVDGVVCSPLEIEWIKKKCGSDFIIVTPGVRPTWAETNDQKRTMTPRDAVRLGADYLVVGRPILSAKDRKEAVRKILQEMKEPVCP
jgi:orotidine-5'-phosphate decarboxylase